MRVELTILPEEINAETYPNLIRFKDFYNNASLLKPYGMKWVDNVASYCYDDSFVIDREGIKSILATLKFQDATFRHNITVTEVMPLSSREEVKAYFERKSDEFIAFLRLALEMDCPIDCDLGSLYPFDE